MVRNSMDVPSSQEYALLVEKGVRFEPKNLILHYY